MATSTSSVPGFNGSSTYAAQLQATITRAVGIASLPLTQLQNTQSNLTSQQSELSTLTNTFSAMQAAVSALQASTGAGAFSTTTSDSTVASASISSGVLAGTYALNVVNVGSQTNAISQNGLPTVSDPSASNIDSSTSFQLYLNGKEYDLSDAAGTLNGLASAINSSSASVQASVINIGSSTAPDYRLSVQSLNYAADAIQLSNGTNSDLLSTLSTGTPVSYQINQQPSTPITSNSRTVNISPGLSVNLLQAGTTDVSVAQSSSNLSGALSTFASAYNTVTAELNKNRGQNGGALTGNSIIYQLQNTLQGLLNFSGGGTGAIHSLSDIGLSFDQNGQLQFDQAAFNQTASTSPNDLLNFIGTTTTGGFLEQAGNVLSSITDPSAGMLAGLSTTFSKEATSLGTQITDEQTKISQLQTSLTQQMADADTTISSLQSQLTEITDLFSQMQTDQRTNSGY